MITSQPNMGHKYPFQSNNKSNKVNQNIFTTGSQITTNNQNDIHRRDAHTATPSSSLRSYNNRYRNTQKRNKTDKSNTGKVEDKSIDSTSSIAPLKTLVISV